MSLRFACPSCGASGSVDAALVGKAVRCKHCKYRFAIPGPGEAEDAGYALEGPIGETPIGPEPGSAFVPRRGVEPTTGAAPRKIKRGPVGIGFPPQGRQRVGLRLAVLADPGVGRRRGSSPRRSPSSRRAGR